MDHITPAGMHMGRVYPGTVDRITPAGMHMSRVYSGTEDRITPAGMHMGRAYPGTEERMICHAFSTSARVVWVWAMQSLRTTLPLSLVWVK